MFSKHKRTAKEEEARGKEEEGEQLKQHSTTMPPLHSMNMCSHICGTSGRCIFTASISSLSSGGESIAPHIRDPRASEYTRFHTTWLLNTNKLLQLFKEQWSVLLLGEKTNTKLEELVKYCNLWAICVTFKSHFVHIQLSPFVLTVEPNSFVKWMWLHCTWCITTEGQYFSEF